MSYNDLQSQSRYVDPLLSNRTFSARVDGEGAVEATVIFQGSNDDSHWETVTSVTLSGTDTDSDEVSVTSLYPYVRAHVSRLVGARAVVTAWAEAISAGAAAAIATPVTTDAAGNLAVGAHALEDLAAGGTFNVGLGKSALAALTTGDQNVAVGTNAGAAIVTASDNTAIGGNSGNATGSHNTAVGSESLGGNAAAGAAADNTAVGYQALTAVTSGGRNTAVGVQAGAGVTTAADNTAVGYGSGSGTGANNVAIGAFALGGQTAGTANVAVGRSALIGLSDGTDNVAVGYAAGDEISTGIDNILLGYKAGKGLGNISNAFVVGSSDSPIDSVVIPSNHAYGPDFISRIRFRDNVDIYAGPSAPNATHLANSSIMFYMDEGSDKIMVRVKYSDGTLGTAELTVTPDP